DDGVEAVTDDAVDAAYSDTLQLLDDLIGQFQVRPLLAHGSMIHTVTVRVPDRTLAARVSHVAPAPPRGHHGRPRNAVRRWARRRPSHEETDDHRRRHAHPDPVTSAGRARGARWAQRLRPPVDRHV